MTQHVHPKKRFVIAMTLSIIAGIMTVWYTGTLYKDIWGSALMWSILTNRILLGLLIGFAGAYTHHPILGFSIHWGFRGFTLGLLCSLTLAFGIYSRIPHINDIFWYIFVSGGLIGIMIDFFATKIGGEGKNIAK